MITRLTITAVADRDPSCNLYTLTQTFDFPLSDPPTPSRIKATIRQVKGEFKESWPHNQTMPHLIPVDVDVRTVER